MQEFIDWLVYGYSIATWYEWAFLISTSLYVFLILFLTIGSLLNPKEAVKMPAINALQRIQMKYGPTTFCLIQLVQPQ